jgi:hypothetical protein
MSGLLQGIMVVVGLAAAIFTGGSSLALVAAALSATAFAAQQGWLGKGAKNFANSAVGHDLTLAVGLASAAVAIGGAVSAASSTSSTAVDAANAAAEGPPTAAAGGAAAGTAGTAADATNAAGTAGDAAATPTVSLTSNEVMASPGGPGASAFQFQNAEGNSVMADGLTPQGIDAANDQGNLISLQNGMGGVGGNEPLSTDSVTNLQNTVTPAAAQNSAAQGAAIKADTNAVNPGGAAPGPSAGATAAGQDESALAAAQQNPGTPAAAPPGGITGAIKGAADKVGDALSTPTGMLMAGQAISGLAQGKAQESIMQRQLAAAQWGNNQWQDKNQVAQLDAQAATPLSVPQGYLQRAAAVRNLMNGSTNQTTPLQTANGAPPTVTPPQAQPLAAPGAGLATGQASSGPVPVYAMNATPRGGVI